MDEVRFIKCKVSDLLNMGKEDKQEEKKED